MASDNKQPLIAAQLKQALKLQDIDPDDLVLWACIAAMAQISEALHGVYLHRNCDRRFAATVMMIQRAGRMAHKLRNERPSRGSVEFVETHVDNELAEALGYLFLAAKDRPSLQFRAARWARNMVEAAQEEDTSDLTSDDEEEIAAWEAVSNEALELLERDLRASRLDAGGDALDIDPVVLDEGDFWGSVGDGPADRSPRVRSKAPPSGD